MNNAFLANNQVSLTMEEPVDRMPELRARETELVQIIESLQHLQTTKDWRVLKEKVFDQLTGVLEGQLNLEARKESPDVLRQNRLAGQLKWSETYSDMKRLEDTFRVELSKIRKLLHGNQKDS